MSGTSEAIVLYRVEIMSMGGGHNSTAFQEEKVTTAHPLTVPQILRYGGDALNPLKDKPVLSGVV
jgi:hypothetical protein